MKVLLWDTNFEASPGSQRCHIFLAGADGRSREPLCIGQGSEQAHVVEVSKHGFSFAELALRGRESRLDGETEQGRHKGVALFSPLALFYLVRVPVRVRPDVLRLAPVPQPDVRNKHVQNRMREELSEDA